MPLTYDDTALLAGLDRLLIVIDEAAADGLDDAAGTMETHLQDTQAHGDQSGATRASYRAIPIGADRDGSAAASSGYAAAADHLANFHGHGGQPLREDSDVVLGEGERGILLTSFTDYQDDLETENPGQKATLGPVLQQDAQLATASVARASKARLG